MERTPDPRPIDHTRRVLVVRGTKKLRDWLRGAPPLGDEESTTALGDWFATALFWRPQVALLVNERTLLPVFVPLAPAGSLLDRVPAAIASVLRLHSVDEAFVAGELEAMREIRLGPTNNRSVVGMLNEFAFLGETHWKHEITDNLDALSVRLASTPCGPLYPRHISPDRELAALVTESVVGASEAAAERMASVTSIDTRRPTTTATVYQLKITLLDTKPPIWRRVLVPADITLDALHEVIQAAFGWWNYHLHDFEFGRTRYGVPDVDDWNPPKDERKAKLAALATEGTTFRYTYDFGDNWRHKIVVEKILSSAPDARAPSCIDGRRACPPEDCGGPWGYEELLAVLADPTHVDHAERLEWVGGQIDPDRFDPSDFDDQLRLGERALFDDE